MLRYGKRTARAQLATALFTLCRRPVAGELPKFIDRNDANLIRLRRFEKLASARFVLDPGPCLRAKRQSGGAAGSPRKMKRSESARPIGGSHDHRTHFFRAVMSYSKVNWCWLRSGT